MTIIIPEGAIQFVLQYASDDFVRGRAATILGFRPVETATEEEMAEAVYQSYLDNLAGSLSNRIELLPALWTGATTSGTVGAGGTGSVSIETPPPNTALLTRKVTARRGRPSRQGRACRSQR